ncbi:prolyl 4-hydroxylase subunit alpha-3 isoform X4 [Danio rerio]|uniref:Prolyl 4-hydroxylase subunit alpha-3 n=4 Tax=Danio rerio TaxID=7955 RepID=A0A8M9PC84_DANRE|nr:prolyl 4-hydroxylase subunit alpha-3 isoform X2 [Danio rerio]|eukprot:XP_021322009.1 prolyl 4-hydroxylase subunit alpha-3 isoform X2 [Danio rerio]
MCSCFTLFIVLYLLNMPDESFGEMFTSMLSVNQAVSAERKLIDHLIIYIEHEAQRLEDIKRFFSRVTSLHDGIYNEPSDPIANPIAAFKLVKRLKSEWLNVVHSTEAEENIKVLREDYRRMESSLPKLEDLRGAAHGLMRLQDVYNLHVESLVRGHFQQISDPVDFYKLSVSDMLSGDDCFLVGKVAYDLEDYYHSVLWFEEAVRLFRGTEWSPENEGTLEDALDHLAFSHFKTGNISHALSLSRELLLHDPMNRRVHFNVEKYEKLLNENLPATSSGLTLKRPDGIYLRTRNAYEQLCQTKGSQPIRREIISLQPYVVLFHGFVTQAEAKNIRKYAMPGLRRSVVASGMNQATAEYRISKSAWLKESAHEVVGKLDQRITLVTGLNVQPPYAEYLQVVNYGIGGHYEPHFDHATSDSSPLYRLKTGNRVATIMIYLSPVQAGGSTAFIYANFSVPVVQNAALFWWNLHKNGQGNVDTLHAGCPVIVGNKWGMFKNKNFHKVTCTAVTNIVHPKIIILSSSTHSPLVQILFKFFSYVQHNRTYTEEWWKPLLYILYFDLYNGCQWLLFFNILQKILFCLHPKKETHKSLELF